jgi:hypothetical protein
MKIFQSIDELPIYNFDRFLATQDNNWLLKNYDGRAKRIDIGTPEIEIMEQYYNALQDRSFEVKLQKWAKIDNLIAKYKAVAEIIFIMYAGFENTILGQELRFALIQELKAWRYKMPEINSAVGDIENLNRISSELQGIKNQIAILQNELKDDGKKENISLYKQLAIIQMGLEIAPINPRKVVVAQWIEYVKIMQEKAKQN